jgi:hypothetical protein
MRPENEHDQSEDEFRGDGAAIAPDHGTLIASWTPATTDRRQATLYLRFPKRGRRKTDPPAA